MSTTLREVIEAGGYDLTTLDDAEWLLGVEDEFNELIEQAEELVDAEEARLSEEEGSDET